LIKQVNFNIEKSISMQTNTNSNKLDSILNNSSNPKNLTLLTHGKHIKYDDSIIKTASTHHSSTHDISKCKSNTKSGVKLKFDTQRTE